MLIIGLSLLILYQGLGEKAVDQSLTNNTEAAQQLGANLGQWIVSSVNNNLANNNTITLQLKYSGGDTTYLASYNNIITDLTLELI